MSWVRVQPSPTFNKTLGNIFIFDSIANEAKSTFHIALAQTNKESEIMFLFNQLQNKSKIIFRVTLTQKNKERKFMFLLIRL